MIAYAITIPRDFEDDDQTPITVGMFADRRDAVASAVRTACGTTGVWTDADADGAVRDITGTAVATVTETTIGAWAVPDGAWAVMGNDMIIGWHTDRFSAEHGAVSASDRVTLGSGVIEFGVVTGVGTGESTGFRVVQWDVWAGGRVIGSYPSFGRAVMAVSDDRDGRVIIRPTGTRYIATMIDDWDGAEINLGQVIVSNYAG